MLFRLFQRFRFRAAPLALALALAACAPEAIDPALTPADLVLEVSPPETLPALPDGVRVRALTFNIHGGADAPPERIGAWLGALGLDLVGLEECPEQAVEPIAHTSGFVHSAYSSGLLLLSKTPLSSTVAITLYGRRALNARTEIAGVRFSIYVVHIGWNAEGNRQARLLADVLRADPEPRLLMMGDFNDEHGSTQNTILEDVVVDAFTALGWYAGRRISWPARGFDGTEGSQLIDLVFFRKALPAIVIAADVLEPSPPMSDHRPALAELLYPAGDAPFAEDPTAAIRDPWRRFPPEGARPTNLLANPGAEDGLAGWIAEGEPATAAERLHRSPHGGSAFFTGYPSAGAASALDSGASQEVDLGEAVGATAIDEGRGELLASAHLATGYEVDIDGDVIASRPIPYDDAEVVIEILGAGGEVLRRTTSQRRDTLVWSLYTTRLPIPPGARRARVRWIAHRKQASGSGNDGAVDDLYLAARDSGSDGGLLGGDLVHNGGAEIAELAGFEAAGFTIGRTGAAIGLMLYPPWSYSGGAHFWAGGQIGADERPPGTSTLRQHIQLDETLRERAEDGDLALRWGGELRTYDGTNPVQLRLTLLDGEGVRWGTLDAPPVTAAEWTHVEQRTRIPGGVASVEISVESNVSAPNTGAFADELFALPERVTH